VKCITFDLTDTLYRFSRPVGATYAQIAARLGLSKYGEDKDLMNRAFKTAFKQTLLEQPCYSIQGIIDERQWWNLVVQRCIAQIDSHWQETHTKDASQLESLLSSKLEFDRYFRAVYQAYGQRENFEVYEDAEATLQTLSRRGYMLGVVTNSPRRSIECTLPLLEMDQFFDFALSCVDVGVMKPDRRVFQHALLVANSSRSMSRSGAKLAADEEIHAEEILHIGNERTADYEGARAAGFQSLLLTHRQDQPTIRKDQQIEVGVQQLKSALDMEPRSISRLSDLLDILPPLAT
jgi:REG-2-like HAD superfamily hydrolase